MTPPPKASVLTIHIDGAARGNPGPSGIGVVFFDRKGKIIKEVSLSLGESTNNVAEYAALLIALQEALKRNVRDVHVFSDSELLVRQVSGDYKVKDTQLKWLHLFVQNLIAGCTQFELTYIPREKNKKADRLANQAVTEALRRQARPAKKVANSPPSVTVRQSTFW